MCPTGSKPHGPHASCRRRGVPQFAPVVVRDPRNVTGVGIVDGEGVVERALVPGEAVVEMVFEL